MKTNRKALVVGINTYDHFKSLYGCVADATDVARVLERNGDQTRNFGVKSMICSNAGDGITKRELKTAVAELFGEKMQITLFYFAGHGFIDQAGGYLLTSECRSGDEGLSLSDIIVMANDSPADSRIIILDSCHSGIAGAPPGAKGIVVLKEGTTILTASTDQQYATEKEGRGVFTSLFVDALEGAAANLTGDITPGSIYAHIDQSLGEWQQRPIFKTNVSAFISLRSVPPPISFADLRRIAELFPKPNHHFALDPSYEPDMIGRSPGMAPPFEPNVEKYKILQRYNRLQLLVPVDAPHMWHAAMGSTSCRLTALGEHYRRLAARGLL